MRSPEGGGGQAVPAALTRLAASRVAIESVDPEIDGGRFAAKAVQGRPMVVEADIFADGHEVIRAAVVSGESDMRNRRETDMTFVVNDRWRAEITFTEPGPRVFTILAWRDLFGTWRRDTQKKLDAGQDVGVELIEGRALIAASKGTGVYGEKLEALRAQLEGATDEIAVLMDDETWRVMRDAGPRGNVTRYRLDVPVWVDRERAAFSAWYELFPRSLGSEGRHGTFDDVIAHLPYVQDMGFDVLYFPPIHPIGTTNRKGKNNALRAEPGDVGSPYAIGAEAGGHMAVHPELGTLEDFDRLVEEAARHGLEIALDIALNASPDHPWIRQHPNWFEWRPDGSIKYAENPPKKYEDIVNFRYYMDDGSPNVEFWEAVRDLFLFWADHGVISFRVDNPHTKPYPFWEWVIAEVRTRHPGAIFLSEAFTRPKVMKHLAKLGFNQSYTYYTWRTTKAELTQYVTELSTEECRHYMRPNFFTNTPDINPVFNQASGRPGFRTRLLMAATLVDNYGVYSGFEFCEGTPLPGREEYLDSEKYELRKRNLDEAGHIKDDIRFVNALRRREPAMQDFTTLRFLPAYDERVLYYGRFDRRTGSHLLFHVLLDPHAGAEFGFELPLWMFGLPDDATIEAEDVIHGNRFVWDGKHHRLTLDPHERPYAVWKLTTPELHS